MLSTRMTLGTGQEMTCTSSILCVSDLTHLFPMAPCAKRWKVDEDCKEITRMSILNSLRGCLLHDELTCNEPTKTIEKWIDQIGVEIDDYGEYYVNAFEA
jgi:hypothetical protein